MHTFCIWEQPVIDWVMICFSCVHSVWEVLLVTTLDGHQYISHHPYVMQNIGSTTQHTMYKKHRKIELP
jgi:uncharacterized protein YqjF (DUF2071 family)